MERRWQVLTVVSVAVFMVSLDLFIVNIAFPHIAGDFHGASLATVSWVLNAYAIVIAALMVPAGRMADRAGRRRAFLAGLALFAVGSALCGAAPTIGALVVARVVQAAGAALIVPTSLALLLPEFTAAQRPAAIGIWAAVGGIAAAAGPPLGGLLVEVSWRLVFLVNVPVALLAIAYGRGLLRESRDEAGGRPDLAGSAILALAVGLLALALVKAPSWGWSDARTIGGVVVAGAGLVAFWRRCLAHPVPVVEPAMLRVRSYALASTASLLFSAAFAAMLLGVVLYMTGVWGDTALRAGFGLSPGPLMAATFAVTSGRFANRIGQRALATAGLTLFGLGCVWWRLRLGAGADYAGEMLPGLLLSGTGVGLVLPSLASAAAASLPPARFATGSAVFTMSRQLGYVLGVAILVALLGTGPAPTFGGAWVFMAIACGLGAVAAFAIGVVRPYSEFAPGAAAVAPAAPASSAVQVGEPA
ncbi:MAG TPA: MFS transporter [Solirubrobacteraceae bacterium]